MKNYSSEYQLKQLNQNTSEARLTVLKSFMEDPEALALLPAESQEVNNHVHTTYSFSPYSPAASVWFARKAGLKAVGSMDHDSIGAARETLEAGKILGTATTVGFELRVNFTGTALEGRKMNNPDSANIVYMTVHGVPESKIGDVEEFLKPLQAKRNQRNREQTARSLLDWQPLILIVILPHFPKLQTGEASPNGISSMVFPEPWYPNTEKDRASLILLKIIWI
jgi:hypothetical protein